MKKGKSREQIAKEKRENEKASKFRAEISNIQGMISEKFKSGEIISVDPEFHEVSFCLYPDEFNNNQKSMMTEDLELTYLKCDRDILSVYFHYKLRKNGGKEIE